MAYPPHHHEFVPSSSSLFDFRHSQSEFSGPANPHMQMASFYILQVYAVRKHGNSSAMGYENTYACPDLLALPVEVAQSRFMYVQPHVRYVVMCSFLVEYS